ncbi:ATP/GTP-binding protein [Streptomyces sp. NPDC048277]|uniref:ATP/GTP-binding protein n=1 Tax=Streptomyces sp. NPDC048277 TaxID=3155027 RepID=UPI0034115DBB
MVTAAQPATTGTFSPLTTWTGWQQFVDTPRAPARDADDQEWTLEQREDCHARFAVLKTPAIDTISTAVRRLLLLNRGQQGGVRRGPMISRPATIGKTAAVQQLGRTVELADRRRHPHQDEPLPVLFINVPPSSAPNMLISKFARFLGQPAQGRVNQIQITSAVCALLCELGTRGRAGAQTSDQLEYLGERIPATFVCSGIDVESSPLLTGVRGSRLAGRFTIVRNQPLRGGSGADQQIWRDLVHGVDSTLRLRRHKPGTLVTHAAYLHAPTCGLSRLGPRPRCPGRVPCGVGVTWASSAAAPARRSWAARHWRSLRRRSGHHGRPPRTGCPRRAAATRSPGVRRRRRRCRRP